jgi:hypothetical protein
VRTRAEIEQAISVIEDGIERHGDSGQAWCAVTAMRFAFENYDFHKITTEIENQSRFGEEIHCFIAGASEGFLNHLAYLGALKWVLCYEHGGAV